MLDKSQSLGCASSTDLACLCNSANFGYGVRDCVFEACPSGTDYNQVFQFLIGLCQGQFGSISSSSASGGSVTGSAPEGSSVTGTPSVGSTGLNAAIAAVTVGVPYTSDASAFPSMSSGVSGSASGGSSASGSGGTAAGAVGA